MAFSVASQAALMAFFLDAPGKYCHKIDMLWEKVSFYSYPDLQDKSSYSVV